MTFIIASLATFYLSYVLVNLDGPLKIFVRLRHFNITNELLSCFWCTSLWVAALICIISGIHDIVAILATAGIASLINKVTE